MEKIKRQRSVYVTARQKKKLVELITRHPELISCRVSQDFSYSDSQRMWQGIANECNSIPGARKSWRQWRKTWQDLRSKTKKRQAEINGELPKSAVMLTPAERKALGLTNVSTSDHRESTEYIETALDPGNNQDAVENNVESNASSSSSDNDEDSAPEEKVFSTNKKEKTKLKNNTNHSCAINWNMLAVQEQRKIRMKEDYFNFKKRYLRQKLKLMEEQTDALKTIAQELASCNK